MLELNQDLERILVSEEEIAKRNRALGEEITQAYKAIGAEEICIICITNGSVIFAADLLRCINMHVKIDCVRISSYQDETSPVSEPKVIDNIRLKINQQHVLLIDDILDTGRTINKITALLQAQNPLTLKSCVLLNKRGRREVEFSADFVGFEIPNEFVVGYGLDFAERYRNLPSIGILSPALQNPPEWT